MPTGVTVSYTGRVFVNYPHWGDDAKFTVAEIVNGQAVAYPNAVVNKISKAHPAACLYSVQSVVVDPRDRLWALTSLMYDIDFGKSLKCENNWKT